MPPRWKKLRVKVDMKEAAELVRISRSMDSINGGQTLLILKFYPMRKAPPRESIESDPIDFCY